MVALRHPSHPLSRHPLVLLLAMAAALLWAPLFGCLHQEDMKQDALGEHCNGYDDDCRSSLECIDYICQPLMTDPTHCDAICDRYTHCELAIDYCLVACENTVDQWDDDVVADFARCFTDELSCEDLHSIESPPQECYDRLPLPEDRRLRCDEFTEAASACDAIDDDVQQMRRSCRFIARTRSSTDWSKTDACVEAIDREVCDEITECLFHGPF